MKNIIYYPFIVFLTFILLPTISCTKKEKDNPTPAQETNNTKQSDGTGSAAADGAMEDVNDVINNKLGGGSNSRLGNVNTRLEAYNLPCGVVKFDSTTDAGGKKYSLKYGNVTPCGYKKKSGEVTFQLTKGTAFNDKDAVVTINYIDYTVQVLATNDIVKINGSLYITNVSGGYVWEAITKSTSIQHRVRGKFLITHANGAIRERNYFKLRTWSSTSSWDKLQFTVAGDTNTSSYTNVSETGKTLDGNWNFETQITENFNWLNCGSTYKGPFVLKNGTAKMNVAVTNISPAYFQVEAGYYNDYINSSSVYTKVNDCTSNAYKISLVVGTTNTIQYQLY